MIIEIDTRTDPAAITLQAPTDFQAFHVAIVGADHAAFTAAAQELGGLADDDHVLVTRAALEGLAGDLAADPDWQRSLQGMLDYASAKGWLTDDGAIQAHVVR
jgi:hypothetical protein